MTDATPFDALDALVQRLRRNIGPVERGYCGAPLAEDLKLAADVLARVAALCREPSDDHEAATNKYYSEILPRPPRNYTAEEIHETKKYAFGLGYHKGYKAALSALAQQMEGKLNA